MRWLVLVVALVVDAFGSVYPLSDGGDLWQVCQSNRGLYRSGVCQGLIEGFDAGYQLGLVYGLTGRSLYCKPDDATPIQMQTVIATYLEAHPERRREPYGAVILQALRSEWPCVGEH